MEQALKRFATSSLRRRSALLAGAALLAAIAASSCRHEHHATTTTAPKLVPLKITFVTSASCAPLAIAKEEGDFAREGIDAQLTTIDGNASLLAMMSRKLDVFTGPVRSGLFGLMLRGETLQIVADKGHTAPGTCLSEAFIAPPKLADDVARHGFRGKPVTTILGSVNEYLIDRLLAKNHLTRDDIELRPVPRGGDVFGVRNSKLETIHWMSEPGLSRSLAAGEVKVVASPEDIVHGHQFSVIAFGARLIHDDPELGRRFMRAYLRGVQRYNEGKTDRNIAIISRYTKLPPDLLRRSCWMPINDDGQVNVAAVQDFVEWAHDNHYLGAVVPASTWWNPSFIEAARSGHAARPVAAGAPH